MQEITKEEGKAKRQPGEHCRYCGDANVALIKSKCCDRWICCDTPPMHPYGGGFCQYTHEKYSPCYFHYNEGHRVWTSCEECADIFGSSLGDFKSEEKYKEPRNSTAAEFYRGMFNG